jgi:hypothetical protein
LTEARKTKIQRREPSIGSTRTSKRLSGKPVRP